MKLLTYINFAHQIVQISIRAQQCLNIGHILIFHDRFDKHAGDLGRFVIVSLLRERKNPQTDRLSRKRRRPTRNLSILYIQKTQKLDLKVNRVSRKSSDFSPIRVCFD
jgi:hypothetical protein